MPDQIYKYAPVSEVIFGASFKNQIIDLNSVFELRQIFKKEFPIVELQNPLSDVFLKENKLVNQVDVDKVGPFRLRLRSEKSTWLIQIQFNKFYLNWIRKDSDEVGNYPGYSDIKTKFKEYLKLYLRYSITDNRDLTYFELTYHDRLKWQEYIDSLSELDKILNISAPNIQTERPFNNVLNKYTYHIPSLEGYGVLNLNTNSSLENQQILKFEKQLRGSDSFTNLDKWFDKAHEKQLDAFNNTFKESILESWK